MASECSSDLQCANVAYLAVSSTYRF
jgi:hypothetical protein